MLRLQVFLIPLKKLEATGDNFSNYLMYNPNFQAHPLPKFSILIALQVPIAAQQNKDSYPCLFQYNTNPKSSQFPNVKYHCKHAAIPTANYQPALFSTIHNKGLVVQSQKQVTTETKIFLSMIS